MWEMFLACQGKPKDIERYYKSFKPGEELAKEDSERLAAKVGVQE